MKCERSDGKCRARLVCDMASNCLNAEIEKYDRKIERAMREAGYEKVNKEMGK